MKEAISSTSDMIRKLLAQQPRPVSISTLDRSLPVPSTMLMMGLGWLAKEDELNTEMSRDPYSCRVSLKR